MSAYLIQETQSSYRYQNRYEIRVDVIVNDLSVELSQEMSGYTLQTSNVDAGPLPTQ